MMINKRPAFEVVIEYLRQDEGKRTIEIDGHEYGWLEGLCVVLHVFNSSAPSYEKQHAHEVRWCRQDDMPLNYFIKMCDEIPEAQMEEIRVGTAFTAVLSKRH
jgi:hypothetical protein